MSKEIRVLSTKALRASNLQHLTDKGASVVTRSFIRIEFPAVIDLPPAEKVNVIITSANAVAALMRIREQLPVFHEVYCIAGRTEALVREHLAYTGSIIARPYASELLIPIIQSEQTIPLWFFKGDKALPTIPDGLNHAGISFKAIEVYRNVALPHVLKEDFSAILFLSPSAVESFLQHNIIPDNTITFAIGKTTAAALKPFAKQVVICESPTEGSLVAAVVNYFNL
ncbi:MAG: hypothetical protein BGO31_00975 [Bacteroidetes bacterium 43-16]|nr:MAG: hypothetical protein BGO31_00975 [Bacteroidetes bacterium 43-16]